MNYSFELIIIQALCDFCDISSDDDIPLLLLF